MGSLPYIVEDCMGVLQLYSDGTVFRSDDIRFPFPIADDSSVVFRDVLYDAVHGLHLRLIKPAVSLNSNTKLPVLFFLHGGGFCVGSRSWANPHNCCVRLALGLEALVIVPDYRLAPENRLPAAVEDGEKAIEWVKKGEDAWIEEGADLERVFVMGDSSGGNIAHHLAVGFGSDGGRFGVRVRGFVLMAPFFGGVVRTKSEEGPPEDFLNLDALDRFWRLSLPLGEDRDHPLANPFGPLSKNLEGMNLEPIMVMVGENELLKDRVQHYAKTLSQLGHRIEYVEFEGKQHGFFTSSQDTQLGDQVLAIIKRFMLQNSL
ncbi:probable carboxylesterase 15 [Cucurbita maxima]|uniref:Probable carboxylesterase 15 n=1 Tax=Cucurbita maxima TaxID=3661 RepID=A0A6J1KNM6_CUCMA|nr:probable carboxylesterase 15 [Cucurbita maxima]